MAKRGRKFTSAVNWQIVERKYRQGVLSLREISEEWGISESTIRYRARINGWKRDLTQETRQAFRTKSIENLAKLYDNVSEVSDTIKKITDEEMINEAARTQIEVIRQHQKTLGQGHQLTMRLLGELDVITTHIGELEAWINSQEAPRRRHAAKKAIGLFSRAVILRDLAASARLWINMERQAFNIVDDREKPEDQKKLDAMKAEELREEILKDAKKLGLDLTTMSEELDMSKVH